MVDSGPLVVAEDVHRHRQREINGQGNSDQKDDLQQRQQQEQIEVLKMNNADNLEDAGTSSSSPEIVNELVELVDGKNEQEEIILLSEEDEEDSEPQKNGNDQSNGPSLIISSDTEQEPIVENCQQKENLVDEKRKTQTVEDDDTVDDELEVIEIPSTPPPPPSEVIAGNEASNKIVNNNDSIALKHKLTVVLDGKTANNNCLGRTSQESPKEGNNTSSKQTEMGLSEENRKVEPLKINLHREPIRTIIKLPPGSGSGSDHQPSSPKITIKPLKPPPSTDGAQVNSIPKLTIKPVVNPEESSSNTLASSEQMQIIPKLHIKNSSLDSSGAEGSEPHIVPKLTIRGVNHISPTVAGSSGNTGNDTSSSAGHNSSNSSSSGSPPLVPKLTIKKDNLHHHSSHHHHHHHHHSHHNNRLVVKEDDPPAIPKLHIKAIPEPSVSLSLGSTGTSSGPVLTSSEGVKLTIKPIPEPPLPKLTIKTSTLDSNDVSVVSSTSSSFSPKLSTPPPASPSDQHSNITSTIPKLTIKPIPKPPPAIPRDPSEVPIPKLTIKPMPPKPTASEDSCSSETSINSLESSPISSSSSSAPSSAISSPSIVPKLTIKVPKENDSVVTSLPQITSGSITTTTTTSSSTIPIVTKLNIKPMPPQPKEPANECSPEPEEETQAETRNLQKPEPIVIPKVTIKTITNPKSQETEILSTPKVTLKPIPRPEPQPVKSTPPHDPSTDSEHSPLEVTTSSSKTSDSGCDSPRIILKINKGSSCTTTTSAAQSTPVTPPVEKKEEPVANKVEEPVNDLKRSVPESSTNERLDVPEVKKIKLNHQSVIVSNQEVQRPIVDSDVIVIDDDSKSDMGEEPAVADRMVEQQVRKPPPLIEIQKITIIPTPQLPVSAQPEDGNKLKEMLIKARRQRAKTPTPYMEPRPRRTAALQAIPASVLLRRQPSSSAPPIHIPVVEPVPVALPISNNITSVLLIENDEGSSSDCMIIDDPLTLAEKNGTSSNSNSSSFNSVTPVPVVSQPTTPVATDSSPGSHILSKVRMSTRSGAGGPVPTTKDTVITHKAPDKDSGLDEGKLDSEDVPTPAKRPRGRPKKNVLIPPKVTDELVADEVTQETDSSKLTIEANGSTSSSELPPMNPLTLFSKDNLCRVSPRVLLKPLTPSRLEPKPASPLVGSVTNASADSVDVEESTCSLSKDPLGEPEVKPTESVDPVSELLPDTPRPRGRGRGRGRGSRGVRGLRGVRGPRGLRGVRGPRGVRGIRGRFAAITQSAQAVLITHDVTGPSDVTLSPPAAFAGVGSAELPLRGPGSRGGRVRPRGRGRGRGRGSRGGRGGARSKSASPLKPGSPMKFTPGTEFSAFMTPDGTDIHRRRLQLSTPLNSPSALQVFEEDTRMSGDFNFTTPMRLISTGAPGGINEESQSSYLSSASVTQDNSTVQTILTTTTGSARKPKAKMEVVDANGRTEFAVEMLAEYEWPLPTAANPRSGGDSFMIQEQIAEYLGVKSFKRKYPDLMRRPVDMEERNYIMERGMASEKMCDLGLTAVYASEILDIMCNDYPEKYEEYKRYQREKHYRDRQKYLQKSSAATAIAIDSVDRCQMLKDKAIQAAARWNINMNKERKETRRACMDLQTYVVQVPRVQRLQTEPSGPEKHYPIALVPGQFSEYYRSYTPEELACYPINTALLNPYQLREILHSERYRKLLAEVASESDGSSSSSSSSDEDDSSSDSDDSDDGSDSDSGSESGSSSVDSDSSDLPLIRAPGKKMPLTNSTATNSRFRAPPPKTNATPSLSGTSSKSEEASKPKPNPYLCAVCLGPQNKNQQHKPERFIRCSLCRRRAHPSCIDMSAKMFKRASEYPWQCSECKSCQKCHRRQNASVVTIDSPSVASNAANNVVINATTTATTTATVTTATTTTTANRKMAFCDQCDRGFHLTCIGLRNVPDGRWHCTVCSICNRCGTRSPEGHPNPYLTQQQRDNLAMVANWTHEYATNELTRIREHVLTLCVPCVRLRKQQEEARQQRLQQSSSSTTEAGKAPSGGTDADSSCNAPSNNTNHIGGSSRSSSSRSSISNSSNINNSTSESAKTGTREPTPAKNTGAPPPKPGPVPSTSAASVKG